MEKINKFLRFTAIVAVICFSIAACDGGSLADVVNSRSTYPEEIRLNMPSLKLVIGGKENLTATIIPTNATNKSVTWNSSDPQVATVASNGAVSALSAGSTTITATTVDGGKTATCAVTVTEAPTTVVEPTDIILTPPSISMNIGDTGKLIVSVTPSNAAKDINWISENPAAVVVDPTGNITAKGEGTAKIYAVTVVGGKRASSDVTVKNPLPATIRPVLGHGYDITGRYAYSPDIKAAVLDLEKLLVAKLVQEDPNFKYGEYETITGKDINDYMRSITANLSHSANANVKQVVSFAAEVGANFSKDRIVKAEYVFATSTSRIVAGAYKIENKGLDAYFTQDFIYDLDTMELNKLIERYGTHVMLGAVIGARADHHLSVQKKAQTDTTQLEAYAKQSAEVTYKGVTGGGKDEARLKLDYSDSFFTQTTVTKTRVFGGNAGDGREIQDKNGYNNWIKSITGNELWIDFYPGKLIPLSDLVTGSRKDDLAQAIVNYCSSTEFGVLPSYELTIEQFPKNFGILKPAEGKYIYSAKTPYAISATANSGNQFIGWTVRKGDDKSIPKPGNKDTTVTLNSETTIRANFIPDNINYGGEIGKFSLKNNGAFVAQLKITYLQDNGTPTKPIEGTGDITAGVTKVFDPDAKGIPDGSIVRIYSWVSGGYDREGGEYFIYKRGSSKTAYYTHSGTTLVGNKLTYNGIK